MAQRPSERNISIPQTLPPGTLNRAGWLILRGHVNKPEWPSSAPESELRLAYCWAFGCVAYGSHAWPPNSRYVSVDAPNMRGTYYATTEGWNSRLYATAYSKFTEAARQGSAEWGMNIVQGRQSLKTLVQLAITSAATVAAFAAAHRVGLAYLKKHVNTTPASVERRRRKLGRELVRAKEARARRRISNEIWVLDQVTSTLLAYRYGLAPLMSDIHATTKILSEEFKDVVTLRKSATTAWSRRHPSWDDSWVGTESVVLKATVSCHNPNLLLANRLGITNPQMWAWDSIPWGFIVDWWFPIGSFLQNFTALVGLTLKGASVTRTRSWAGVWRPITDPDGFYSYTPAGDMRFRGKRKERTTGTLPIPLSVPYGTGLGVQRGQNALALIVQRLK